jgi:ATP-dependent RNA helicase SUPV3L1/SUV3
VRFGAFNIYLPLLLKPAAGELRLALWALKHAGEHGLALEALPEPPKAGRTSVAADPALPAAFYRATGYHLCGQRAVRTDILERLADQIRPLIAWRPGSGGGARPKGATGDGGFVVVPEMLSILGCSAEELGGVLRALGFHVDRRPAPKTMIDPAPITPVAQPEAAPADGGEPAAPETAAPAETEAVSEAVAEPASVLAETEAAEVPASEVSEVTAAEDAPTPDIEAAVAASEVTEGVENETAAETASVASEAAEPVAEGATDAAPAAPAEEALIEIWRPRRRHRGEHRAVDGRPERQGDRNRHRGRDGRREGGRRPDRPAAPAAAAPSGSEQAPAGAAPPEERREGGRPERNQRGGPPRHRDGERREGRPDQPRGPREDRERRHGGGKGHGGKGHGGEGRRDDRREDRRPPREDRSGGYMRSAAPPKRTTVDPDSPFAALSALKQQLEKRSNETGSS